MAVQLNYLAKKGWKPQNSDEDYLITLIKLELSKIALKEAKGKPIKKLFEDGAASVAAESSTGTWTKVYSGKGSGIPLSAKKRAMDGSARFNAQKRFLGRHRRQKRPTSSRTTVGRIRITSGKSQTSSHEIFKCTR